MTVEQLVIKLQTLPQDDEVRVFSPIQDEFTPLSEFGVESRPDLKVVFISG